MRMLLQQGDRRHVVETHLDGSGLGITFAEGAPMKVEVLARDTATLLLRVGDRLVRARYARRKRDLFVQVEGHSAVFHLVDEQELEEAGAAAGSPIVRAPMPGKILAVLAAPGDAVRKGQPVVRMEAMKMEVDVAAPMDGEVESIGVKTGDQVVPDAALLRLAPTPPSG